MYQTSQPSKRSEQVKHACQTVDEHFNELAEQMRAGKSEQLVKYLEFTATFHQYSFRNILLAFSQRENITQLAGIRQWNQLGRRVRPGEKGIMILAPMSVRIKPRDENDEDPDERDVVTLFKPVYVFDVSQTEGDPVPSLMHTQGDATMLHPAVQEAIREANIALEFADHIVGSLGAYGASYGGRIVVRTDLDAAEAFRTMVHEFAHEKLHKQGARESKTVRETEADATAFVVCRHFGLQCDTSDYLLLYDATPKVLLERFEAIRTTAGEIIAAIGQRLPNTLDNGNNDIPASQEAEAGRAEAFHGQGHPRGPPHCVKIPLRGPFKASRGVFFFPGNAMAPRAILSKIRSGQASYFGKRSATSHFSRLQRTSNVFNETFCSPCSMRCSDVLEIPSFRQK